MSKVSGCNGGDSKNTLYCSFCGKSQHEVRKLIAGPDGVHLRRVRRIVHGHHPRGEQDLDGEVPRRVPTPQDIMKVLDELCDSASPRPSASCRSPSTTIT